MRPVVQFSARGGLLAQAARWRFRLDARFVCGANLPAGERSPMPELRLVVLALQDWLAYGPTFESAMAALFGGAASSMNAAQFPQNQWGAAPSATSTQPAPNHALIAEAARTWPTTSA